MHTDTLRLTFRSPFPARVFEISDEFLLLGIHGDDGLVDALKSSNLLVDVAKLPVPVGMTFSFLKYRETYDAF